MKIIGVLTIVLKFPFESVLAPFTLTRTLPDGRPHLALKSTSVADKLPSLTPRDKPKSDADTGNKSNIEHSTVSVVPSLSLSTSKLSSTPSPSWSPLGTSIVTLPKLANELFAPTKNILKTKKNPRLTFISDLDLRHVIFSINDSFITTDHHGTIGKK